MPRTCAAHGTHMRHTCHAHVAHMPKTCPQKPNAHAINVSPNPHTPAPNPDHKTPKWCRLFIQRPIAKLSATALCLKMKRAAPSPADFYILQNKKIKLMFDPVLKGLYQNENSWSVTDDIWKLIQHFHTMLRFQKDWEDSNFLICHLVDMETNTLLDTRSYTLNSQKTGCFGTWLKHIQYVKDFKFVRGIYQTSTRATMTYRSRADAEKTINFTSYHHGDDFANYSSGDFDPTNEVLQTTLFASK